MSAIQEQECRPDDQWPISKKYAFFAAFIAFGLGLFDFIDRQLLAAVLPFIREEWHITDTQAGLLVSIVNMAIPAFLIPSAYFIDHWSRKKMLAIMGTIWSLATGACAIAGTYTHLLICRFFIGAGEAGYNPAAIPLLSACFPKKWRGTAISITQIGTTMGIPLGTIIGAYIATHWGWRHAFGIVMIPGLLLAIGALFLKDYNVVESEEEKAKKQNKASYLKTIATIVKTPSLLLIIIGAVFYYLFGGIGMAWLPSYFTRVAGIPITQASFYASIIFVSGTISITCAGPIIDFARRYPSGPPILLTCAMIISFSCHLIGYAYLTPGSINQVAILVTAKLLSSFTVTGMYVIVMAVAEQKYAATALSTQIFCQNILGFSLGPVVTGFLSDKYSLDVAMQITPFILLVALFCFFLCCFTYRRDVEKVGCNDVQFN